jgi:glutaminyl-tRNA synthetase
LFAWHLFKPVNLVEQQDFAMITGIRRARVATATAVTATGFPPTPNSPNAILASMTDAEDKPVDFIRKAVSEDIAANKNDGRIHTRFPPEPNGYLHLGHAKSICLNFGLAKEMGGKCNLRFDDTNPEKEDTEFVDSIREDVRWLGFEWDGEYFASDYFDQLYEWAVQLIKDGKAYVCDQTVEEVREYRGGWNKEGKASPFRDRSAQENLDLFEQMKNGDFKDGEKTLRAKIDMNADNMNLRDPAMYRIRHATHHRTGDKWCIYPNYDWAHGQSDSIEGITHSLCTLEFENHRPLYDWYVEQLGIHHPQQIEFAKLVISHTMMSKRKLTELVQGNYVDGWDDPRMPTLSGMRRRGVPPEALRDFCERVGITKFNSMTDLALLNLCIRDHLNKSTDRMMVILDPIKVVIENYPEGESEIRNVINNPEDETPTTREMKFGREIYIERSDFMEDAPKKFFRLSVGREVRLRFAYFLKCNEVIKDENGEIVELRCTYDPETSGGKAPDGRKVKGTIHWVSAEEAVDAEVRLYDVLFENEDPSDVPAGKDWKDLINPNALKTTQAKIEKALVNAKPGEQFQFVRNGYFVVDSKDSQPSNPVFNRTVTLKDAWAKVQKKKK